jgi:hypothetical protein
LALFFVCFWLVLLSTIAWLGGWSALARHYKAVNAPSGQRFSMQSGALGWIDYNGCLTLRVCPEGLYLAIWPLFRFAHPPLLIPWSALHVLKVQDKWWSRHVDMAVDTPAIARLRLPLKVVEAAQKLSPAAGRDAEAAVERPIAD